MAEAKQALENEAAESARAAAERKERDRQVRHHARHDDDHHGDHRDGDGDGHGEDAVDEQAVAGAGDRAAAASKPRAKAQRNFTDPDSRIMKSSDGAFIQAYNGQAVVDEDNQIIVGADVSSNASDCPSLDPMLDQAEDNAGAGPGQALADAGYCSAANLAAAEKRQAERDTETFMATGRTKHDERVAPEPRDPIPAGATPKQRMARKLRAERGRAAYARRKVIVEPVFGQIDTLQYGKRLLLRGIDGARGEWRLLAACHNLRKIFTHAGSVTQFVPATG